MKQKTKIEKEQHCHFMTNDNDKLALTHCPFIGKECLCSDGLAGGQSTTLVQNYWMDQ